MRVAIPAPRGGNWLGVAIEDHDLGGVAMVAVTIRARAGQMERTWYADGAAALAYALGQADDRCLPMFDFREAGAE